MKYPVETLGADDDDGTMPDNVEHFEREIVGQRIISVHAEKAPSHQYGRGISTILTLSNGKRVKLTDTDDCCAFTYIDKFMLDPSAVDHIITSVETTGGFTKWHVLADMTELLVLDVEWSPGNPFYYGYGFYITVDEDGIIPPASDEEIAAALDSIKKAL